MQGGDFDNIKKNIKQNTYMIPWLSLMRERANLAPKELEKHILERAIPTTAILKQVWSRWDWYQPRSQGLQSQFEDFSPPSPPSSV